MENQRCNVKKSFMVCVQYKWIDVNFLSESTENPIVYHIYIYIYIYINILETVYRR